MSTFRLLALPLALSFTGFAMAVAPGEAAPADLDAFVRALPARGGTDRVFLAPPAALQARLGLDPATLRQADPGVVCDPAAAAPVMLQSALGRVGQLNIVCLPNGTSQGILTLDDGSNYMTTCGHAGIRVTASADLTVGDRHMHVSTEPDVPDRAPTHACSGWVKLPR